MPKFIKFFLKILFGVFVFLFIGFIAISFLGSAKAVYLPGIGNLDYVASKEFEQSFRSSLKVISYEEALRMTKGLKTYSKPEKFAPGQSEEPNLRSTSRYLFGQADYSLRTRMPPKQDKDSFIFDITVRPKGAIGEKNMIHMQPFKSNFLDAAEPMFYLGEVSSKLESFDLSGIDLLGTYIPHDALILLNGRVVDKRFIDRKDLY